MFSLVVGVRVLGFGVQGCRGPARGLQGYGAPVPGVASFMVWSLHAQGGSTPPQGVHASSDALSCGASWPMLGGTICALRNLRNLKDLWGKQNPTPKQQGAFWVG